jgi:hypothetical protein
MTKQIKFRLPLPSSRLTPLYRDTFSDDWGR